MSKQLEGKSCQICHSYLFDDDDIVYCPECGAPYHRDCYASVGKCVLEEFHGTSLQYDKVEKEKAKKEQAEREEADRKKTFVCPHCKRETAQEGDFCPYCGKNMKSTTSNAVPPFGVGFAPYGFVPFDPYGGIPKDSVIEDNVTVEEAAAYVGPKAARYLPSFVKNKKTAWNWAAFLCPSAWFAYRKMYFWAAITFTVLIVSFICLVPFYSEVLAVLNSLPVTENANAVSPAELFEIAEKLVANTPTSSILLFYLSSLITLVTSVLSGLFGEKAYRTKVLDGVKKIKEEPGGDELKKSLMLKGGVNFWLFVLILMVNANSSTIIGIISSFF